MTGVDIMRMLRGLLDDGREWYPSLAEAINSLNEAQRQFLRLCVQNGNERALRPLHRISNLVADGTTISGVAYPRSCMLYFTSPKDANRQYAAYTDYDTFLNYRDPNYATGQKMPQSAKYTFYNNALYFHPNNAAYRGELYYITYPTLFAFAPGNLTGTFDFPDEFHAEIVAIGAKIINEMDVLEYQRSKPVPPETRLDIPDLTLR